MSPPETVETTPDASLYARLVISRSFSTILYPAKRKVHAAFDRARDFTTELHVVVIYNENKKCTTIIPFLCITKFNEKETLHDGSPVFLFSNERR